MTLPLPSTVKDPDVQENLDAIARVLPITGANIANKTVADSKLAKPVIAGLVESTGTVAGGSGFTSEKTGTGVYKIVLTTELGSLASFVATSIIHALIVETAAASKKTFTVAFYSNSGTLTDTAFSFMIKAT